MSCVWDVMSLSKDVFRLLYAVTDSHLGLRYNKPMAGLWYCQRCLSVCMLARLLKNPCMDLGDILRVDRCRDKDELVNF